jgi:hypothetical protein
VSFVVHPHHIAMRQAHGCDEKTMLVFGAGRPYHPPMLGTENTLTRSLTLVLSEDEWRALRDAEPDAVGWLQRQVRDRLAARKAGADAATTAPDYSVDDDY